jgi:hypothetical protein
VGWLGEQERSPHWELRPKSKSLVGVRHLWLVTELPDRCSGARLTVRAECDVETKRFGIVPTGGSTEKDALPSIVIG